MATDLEQVHFRFRTDGDAADATPTWGADEDTNYDPGASPFRLRLGLTNVADASSGSLALYLQKNAGSYAAITISSAEGVKSFDISSDPDDTKILVPRLSLPPPPPSQVSVLLLHMNGVDESTTFTDSSTGQHTVTPVGSAQIDTAQSMFGGASGLFNLGDPAARLSVSGSVDFTFGTDDFTVDFRTRLNDRTGAQAFAMFNSDSSAIYFVIGKNSSHQVEVYSNYGDFILTGTTALENAVWYHIAITRASGTMRLFIEGTKEGSDYSGVNNFDGTAPGIATSAGIGAWGNLNGWLDEFRILKGQAAWTSNFTPPTNEYTT